MLPLHPPGGRDVRVHRRFGEVRELANFVIFELQDAVATLVGSTTLRMTMVERSIAYLDSLAADAAGDPGLQLELAGAYVRLGDVLGLPSEANLGDREGALASYAKAKALYEQALSDSGDADVRRRLARLLLNTRTAHTDIALASEALQESMRIWEDLVREDPSSLHPLDIGEVLRPSGRAFVADEGIAANEVHVQVTEGPAHASGPRFRQT